jgi:hypothetical protein
MRNRVIAVPQRPDTNVATTVIAMEITMSGMPIV